MKRRLFVRLLLLGTMTFLLDACATVINWKRAISNAVAQRRAATAADAAAQMVLSGPETVSALVCQQLRDEMLLLLRKTLVGAKVTKFATEGIEPTSFPED